MTSSACKKDIALCLYVSLRGCSVTAGKLTALFQLESGDKCNSKLAVEQYLQQQASDSQLDDVMDVVIEAGVFKVSP